jgi:hypothetical protein
MSGNINKKDIKILCQKSGNKCSLPKCRANLIVDIDNNNMLSNIAVMAHIKGEKPGAARYDSKMTDKERNCHANLILVCCNDHKVIDDNPAYYSVEMLHQIKESHEKWVAEKLCINMTNISFAELEVVTKYLLSPNAINNQDHTLIPPKDKINKNNLSIVVENLLMMGMVQVVLVKNFISKQPDIEFGERLSQGFKKEYMRLIEEDKLSNDDLFYALLEFSYNNSFDFANRAAGLAVLAYLFEKCDVFEK